MKLYASWVKCANLPHVSIFNIWDMKKGRMKNIEDDTHLSIYVCLYYIVPEYFWFDHLGRVHSLIIVSEDLSTTSPETHPQSLLLRLMGAYFLDWNNLHQKDKKRVTWGAQASIWLSFCIFTKSVWAKLLFPNSPFWSKMGWVIEFSWGKWSRQPAWRIIPNAHDTFFCWGDKVGSLGTVLGL